MGSLSGAGRLLHNGSLNLIDLFPNVDCTEDTCKLLQFRVLWLWTDLLTVKLSPNTIGYIAEWWQNLCSNINICCSCNFNGGNAL